MSFPSLLSFASLPSFLIARFIAFLLIFEAMFASVYVADRVSELGMYGTVAASLILARGLIGAVQFAGGWLLATRRPQGLVFAQWGLAGGAVLTIVGVGLNLAPTSIYHWLHWQATAVYVIYAVVAIVFLQTRTRRT